MAVRKPLVLVGGLPSELPAGDTLSFGAVMLPNATVTETAVVAIGLGARTLTGNVTGLLVGDRIVLTPAAATPAGYVIGQAWCATAGVLSIAVYGPALALGASNTFTLKVAALR